MRGDNSITGGVPQYSLEPDPLRFSDFPIMVVGWGFATVKRGSGRKSLWAYTFRMLLCKHHIKIVLQNKNVNENTSTLLKL